jgi:hypothetical protein
MGGHSAGVKKNKFCALRKKSCPCGNKYRTVCVPGWLVFGYQAHHLLCVACVTEFIGKNKDIVEVVRMTKWCINTGTNMLAMPMSGATIKWYCTLAITGAPLVAPPFKNLPQHDYDHGLYNIEVNNTLKDIAAATKKNLARHSEPSASSLAGELDGESKSFRATLKRRGGQRCGGTHEAWKKGAKSPKSDWYKAFSMAASPTERSFPGVGFDSDLAKKIKKLAGTFARDLWRL